jgi:hypothetical protein
MDHENTTEPHIEIVQIDGEDCVFALFVKVQDGGLAITSQAHGLTREGAIAVLRDYADALEDGSAATHNGHG